MDFILFFSPVLCGHLPIISDPADSPPSLCVCACTCACDCWLSEGTCRGQKSTASVYLFSCFRFWSRISYWTWSWPHQLDWPVRSPHSLVCTSAALGSQVRVDTPNFDTSAKDLNSALATWAASTFSTEPSPPASIPCPPSWVLTAYFLSLLSHGKFIEAVSPPEKPAGTWV